MKIGLLGCGKIGDRHAGLLASGAIPGAGLGGVYDVDRGRAEAFALRYSTRAFPDLPSLAQSVDVVAVLTPSGFHAENVLALVPFAKAVIVEKPMAMRIADANSMISACAAHQVRLFVVKQNRFNRPIVAVRRALERGRFGRLVLGTVRVRWCRRQSYYESASWRGTWRDDGGVLMNQASHHIDLLEWMMGEAVEVSGMATTALARIEAEDTAVATVRFRNGALGVIEATTATRPCDLEGSLSILGEGGAVVVGGFSANELVTWNFEKKLPEDDTVFSEWGKNPVEPQLGFAHSAYYSHVVECLRDGKPALVDGVEARKSLAVLVAIHEAIETGGKVRIGDDTPNCRLGKGGQS